MSASQDAEALAQRAENLLIGRVDDDPASEAIVLALLAIRLELRSIRLRMS